MEKIYLDENGNFEFDFSKADDVIITDKLSHCIPGFQYNVDFIIVDKDIIFLNLKVQK